MEDHYKRGKDDRKEVRIGEEGLKVKLDFSRFFFIMSKVLTSAVFSRRSSEWAERGSASIGQEVHGALLNKWPRDSVLAIVKMHSADESLQRSSRCSAAVLLVSLDLQKQTPHRPRLKGR